MDQIKPRVGISSCLMGEMVRYNGGHQRDRFVMDLLAEHVDFVPFCPEIEAGMGVPRPAIRLVRKNKEVFLMESGADVDRGAEMKVVTDAVEARFAHADLDGFLLKRASPSCGLVGVKVYASSERKAQVVDRGVGRFAAQLQTTFPDLALSEEGWLKDEGLRNQFLHRIFTSRRLKAIEQSPSSAPLQAAHAAHKLLFMAHHPGQQKALGRQLAQWQGRLTPAGLQAYRVASQELLSHRLSRGKHVNVLQHMLGYVSKSLSSPTRHHAQSVINDYGNGNLGRETPLALIKHLIIDKGGSSWLANQVYLNPFPEALR